MSSFMTLIAHILIITGAVLMAYFTLKLIFDAPSTAERNIRIIALMTGFLAFTGSKALGLDVPALLFDATRLAKPLLSRTTNVLFPGGAGTITAWILLRGLNNKDDEDYPFRLMIVLATFILTVFADVYDASFNYNYGRKATQLLPNLSFTVALCLYVVIRHRTSGSLTKSPQDWQGKI